MWLKINNVEELKFVSSDETKDFSILLKGNLLARKRIFYDNNSDLFWVEDLVTSTEDEYTLEQLQKETNIVKSIERGAFFMETDKITASNITTALQLKKGLSTQNR